MEDKILIAETFFRMLGELEKEHGFDKGYSGMVVFSVAGTCLHQDVGDTKFQEFVQYIRSTCHGESSKVESEPPQNLH